MQFIPTQITFMVTSYGIVFVSQMDINIITRREIGKKIFSRE